MSDSLVCVIMASACAFCAGIFYEASVGAPGLIFLFCIWWTWTATFLRVEKSSK